MITYSIILLFIVLITLLFFSIRLNVKLGKNILTIEDKIEESLDKINESYINITAISNTPLLTDEPVVQNLMYEIRNLRNSILIIANELVQFDNDTK